MLFALLLAGVVAVNVAVLRLNLELDQVDRDRSELKADIAGLEVGDLDRVCVRAHRAPGHGGARARAGRPRDHGLRPASPVKRAATNRRIVFLAGLFVALLAVALVRAFWLQALNGDAYAAMAVRQHRETVVVPAARGTIFDRNGEPLAIGRPTTTVFANPRQVDRPRAVTLAAARALDLEPEEVYWQGHRPLERVRLSRAQGGPVGAEQLEERGFAGLGFFPEELRTYPQGRVASQVLGYAGLDNKGLEGLERSLEKVLGGRPGSRTIVKDPSGRALDIVATKPESPGRNVRLTLDHQIQAHAEDVLSEAVRSNGARAASAVVMDPVHGRGARDGRRARLQREPVRDDAGRLPSQSRGHGHVRARLHLQARHRRGRARRGHRVAGERLPTAAVDPASPTASSARRTRAGPSR